MEIERFYAALVESGGKRRAGLAPKSERNTHVVVRKALADAERPGLVFTQQHVTHGANHWSAAR